MLEKSPLDGELQANGNLNDTSKAIAGDVLSVSVSNTFIIVTMPFVHTVSINKLTCRPKKRSADKFDSSDPSYCQFLIKL